MTQGAPFGHYRVTPQTVRRAPRTPFPPTYRLDETITEALRAIERADHDLRKLRLDPAEERRALRHALSRNAFGTASIEGNPLSLPDVSSLLSRNPAPDVLESPDEREIINYARFIEQLPRRNPPRTADDVVELHRELFTGVLADAGRFKDQPNFIGRRPSYEVVFIPTAPRRVRPELDRALQWLHGAPEHKLVKAQVFFLEFQSIHPFRDGNGRAGRALSTWLLHAWGYEGVRYALVDYEFNRDREAYYAALAQGQREPADCTAWLRYMSAILRRTFEGAAQRALFRQSLPPDLPQRQVEIAAWFQQLAARGGQARASFSDVHAAFPGIPARTLQRDLAQLRDAGVLEMQGDRRGARYVLANRAATRVEPEGSVPSDSTDEAQRSRKTRRRRDKT